MQPKLSLDPPQQALQVHHQAQILHQAIEKPLRLPKLKVEMIDFAFKCCHFAMWRNKEQARHKEKQRRKRFGEDGDASDDVTVGTSAGVATSAQ